MYAFLSLIEGVVGWQRHKHNSETSGQFFFSADLLNKTLKEKFKYRIAEYCILHLCISILIDNREKATRLIFAVCNVIPIWNI